MTDTVYIIGSNALACYLGAQIQSSGRKVVLLLDRQSAEETLATDGISVKEDRSLTQKKHKLAAAAFMKEPAEAVIIADYANRLNTALSNVSPAKIGNAPVACFTPLKDMSYLTPIVGDNLHPAFFKGFVIKNKNTVSLLGRSAGITICPPENGEIDQSLFDMFTQSQFQTTAGGSRLLCFWEYFAPYALCSLFSAAEKSKISNLLKDKSNKETFKRLVDEFCALAQTDGISLNGDIVLKGIYNTPANYLYPLHQSILTGGRDDFNLLSSVISDSSFASGCRIPETIGLLKKLYNLILNPTL